MEEQQNHLSLEFENFHAGRVKRRDLLPWWIKAFTWIFLGFGAIIPPALVFGLLGGSFSVSLYGLETIAPISLPGISLIILFLIKAITAFGLWTEKVWAVDVGIFDAILGIVVCCGVMTVLPFVDASEGYELNLRLEMAILIPYLIKLQKIKPLWQEM